MAVRHRRSRRRATRCVRCWPMPRRGNGPRGVQRRPRFARPGGGARLRGPPRRPARWCRRRRPRSAVRFGHGRRDGSRDVHPPGPRSRRGALRSGHTERRRPGGRRPDRAVCDARRLRDGARGRPRPARSHPRRPGRTGAAGARPRLRHPLAGRDAAAPRIRYARPFLGSIPRARPKTPVAALGLRRWVDPHNADRSYARVRARALLVEAERVLGPGVGAALARSADLLRDDADLLDDLAGTRHTGPTWTTRPRSQRAQLRCPPPCVDGSCDTWRWPPARARAASPPRTSPPSMPLSSTGAAKEQSTCPVPGVAQRVDGVLRFGARDLDPVARRGQAAPGRRGAP